MAEVKCEKCGKEYELPHVDNIDSYECQCGGNLNYLDNDVQFSENTDFNFNKHTKSNLVSHESYIEKKISEFKKVMLIGAILSIIGIIGYFSSIPLMFLIFVLGMVLLNYGYKEFRKWNKGFEGEELVAKYLNELPEEYFVFNDVNLPNSRGNIDHVVIGPNGMFAIETKNLSGSYSVKDDQWFYTGKGKYQRSKSQPGKQIKSNSMILLNYFKSNGLFTNNLWIHSIVAFNNPKLSIKERPRHYDIINPSKIPEFIRSKSKPIEKEKLKQIVQLIKPYAHSSS